MASLTKTAGSSFGYWSRQSTDDEYLAKLRFPVGSKVYDNMRRSDPQVSSVIQAINSPLISGNWVIDAADESTQAAEVAKFVEENLFPARREIDTLLPYSTPWTQTLKNILLFVPFGYMVMEKVYKAIDGKIVLSDLAPRLPKTITEFQYDKNGNNLKTIIQKVAGTKYTIPADKAVVFTFNKEGSNAVGISLLRPLYKPWAIKDDLEKIQAIMFERYGVGVPVGMAGENIKPGDEAFTAMEEALDNLAVNETGYIVLPNGQSVSLLESGGSTAPDIKSAIEYYDTQISVAYHTMFLTLGTSKSGNRALSETFLDFFLTTVQAIGDSVADVINNDLIPELVQLNYDVDNFPQLKLLPVQDVNMEVIANLKGAGLISSTEATENRIREIVGINTLGEGEYDAANSLNTDDDIGNATLSDEQGGKVKKDRALSLAEKREFTQEEKEAGLPQAEVKLNSAERKENKRLMILRQEQAEQIARQISQGRKPSEINVKHKTQMYDGLMVAYKEMRTFGQKQERTAARKQGVKLADAPGSANELLALMEEMLSVQVEGASNKLKSLMLEEAIRLKREGITGNALERMLVEYVDDKVSEVTWDQMASTAVNGGWGDGKISVVDGLQNQVDYQIYSAILDENTCEVCAAADGALHAPNDGDYVAPNPGCFGGGRCRCVNITFYKVAS